MIFLEPLGGLANRMRVIATGIALARQLKQPVSVIWKENYELNCPFDQLFYPLDGVRILRQRHTDRFIKRSEQSALKHKVINKLLGIDYCITDEDFPFDDLASRLKPYKNSYINTCQMLNGDVSDFKFFKPVESITAKIDSLANKFNANTVGVQIRRTDNELSKNRSPLPLFINRMHTLLQEQPGTNFFLTTDDLVVEAQLKEIFGNLIVTHRKELSRLTQQGIRDAVADIFTLSKTNLILGSFWSSFSEVAASLNDRLLEVIKRD